MRKRLAQREKREKDRQKTGYGGRPEAAPSPHPASGPTSCPASPATFSGVFAPPTAERQRTGTTRVCEHVKFLPAQWRKTQDSPFPGTSTQSAGNLGVPGAGMEERLSISCTGGHNMDTNTHQQQAVLLQAAVPGEAGTHLLQ